MSLIKCPHCGHTVLSVASHCPNCAGVLGQTFLPLDHEGELAQCRACGHQVRTRTRVCPNCGLQEPARWPRAMRTGLAASVGAIIVVLGLLMATQELPDHQPAVARDQDTAAAPAKQTERPATAAPLADSLATAPQANKAPPKDTTARPDPVAPAIAAAAPRPHDSTGRAAPAHPTPTPTPAPAPTQTASLQTRWTTTWVNVRRAPSNEAQIVRVLGPGTVVHGNPDRWGWWAVQFGADSVGYIAGALLRARSGPGTD